MYVILVNDDNTLTTSVSQRIMQRSKLVDTLWFLVPPAYNGFDMSLCTVLLEYLMPISKKYKTEILNLSSEGYEGYLKYELPVDTEITSEHGKVSVQISFIYSDMDEYGNSVQRVRKVTGTEINVLPINAWSDIIPDSALTSLDQRIIKLDAQMKALNEISISGCENKADSLSYNKETNELQLMAGNKPVGEKVVLETTIGDCECDGDGLPVVDFGVVSGSDSETPEEDGTYDVVIF